MFKYVSAASQSPESPLQVIIKMKQQGRKIYYTMGEVSEMFDVRPSLIRFWEQKFDILKPDKNRKGNRLFTPADVENLKLIYHLVKEKGMTLSGAAKRLRDNREGEERTHEVIERLQNIRSLLLEVRESLKSGVSNTVFEDTFQEEDQFIESVGNPSFHVEADATGGDLTGEILSVPFSQRQGGCSSSGGRDDSSAFVSEDLVQGPALPRFLQCAIPIPPQPVPEELPERDICTDSTSPERAEDSPGSRRPVIIEQSLF